MPWTCLCVRIRNVLQYPFNSFWLRCECYIWFLLEMLLLLLIRTLVLDTLNILPCNHDCKYNYTIASVLTIHICMICVCIWIQPWYEWVLKIPLHCRVLPGGLRHHVNIIPFFFSDIVGVGFEQAVFVGIIPETVGNARVCIFINVTLNSIRTASAIVRSEDGSAIG